MKNLLFTLLLLPQVALAQYREEVFTLDSKHVPVEQRNVELNIQKDTVISLGLRGSIYGLSVTGRAVLENDQDSYVRVILRDDYNYEYLVYECFPMLTETLTPQFQNTALETKSLDGITPQSLRIELLNASISLDSFGYVPESEAAIQSVINSAILLKEQSKLIVSKLNDNLERRNVTWRAGITSVSEMSYEEKKAMFGGTLPQLYGFEHYIDGIFVMPYQYNSVNRTSTSFVSEWDWRNRHGKNWITPKKNQGSCGSCWAFATVAGVESYVNLYYNRLLNYDLSEEELISCDTINHGCSGGIIYHALDYIESNGIVTEICFPYSGYVQNCTDKCHQPQLLETIFIENHKVFDYHNSSMVEDTLKKYVIKSPMPYGIFYWGHAVLLAGYKTINVGDNIYTNPSYSSLISSSDSLVGRTAWLIKNSWNDWGQNGFGYIVTPIYYNYACSLQGKITSMIYSDDYVVCEDADGDGLYFWGLGNRPSFCPSWIPYDEDGDDSNPAKGKILTSPVYGNLQSLGPFSGTPYSGNTVITSRTLSDNDIDILNNATLTIKNILNLQGRPTVYIRFGGHLIIDGGVLTNAVFSLEYGSKITIKNGGKIVMRTNNTFNPPYGVTVNIINGQIIGSNDF